MISICTESFGSLEGSLHPVSSLPTSVGPRKPKAFLVQTGDKECDGGCYLAWFQDP